MKTAPEMFHPIIVAFEPVGRTRGPLTIEDWRTHSAALRNELDRLYYAGHLRNKYDGGAGSFTMQADAYAVRKIAEWGAGRKAGVRVTKIDLNESPEARVWEATNPRRVPLPNETIREESDSFSSPQIQILERPAPQADQLSDVLQLDQMLLNLARSSDDAQTPPKSRKSEPPLVGPSKPSIYVWQRNDPLAAEVTTKAEKSDSESKPDLKPVSEELPICVRLHLPFGHERRNEILKTDAVPIRWQAIDAKSLVGKTNQQGLEHFKKLAEQANFKCEILD